MSGALPELPYRKCAGLMLINRDGLVFIGERRDTPGAWQMPQGGIQKGEEPETAAWRELKEEIGVTKARLAARSKGLLRYEFPDYLDRRHAHFAGKYRGQEQWWFGFEFQGTDDADIDLVKHNDHEGPEFARWRWADVNEAVELIIPFKRDVYRQIAEEFAPVIAAIKKR